MWSVDDLLGWDMSCRAAVSDFYDLKDNVCLLTVNFLPHLKFVRQLNKNQQWQFGVVSCWTLFLSHRFFVNDKNLVLRSRVKEVSTLKCKKQVQRFLIYNGHYCVLHHILCTGVCRVRVHLVDTNKALITFNLQNWVCNIVSVSNLMLVQHW